VHFEALVDVLEQPDATAVRQAVSAVQGLPSVHRCDDADTRTDRLQRPSDPVSAARVEHGRDRLAIAEAMQAAGRYAAAQAAADEAYAIASELDDRPLQAEALHRLGLLAMQDGEFDTARLRQREAFFTAVEARHDETAARAATDLVFSTTMLARLDEAEDWARHAETIADAADLGPELRAWLFDRRGVLRSWQGRHADSLADHEQALAILEPERAPGDLLLAKFVMHTGLALEKLDRLDEARVAYERALATHVAALGPSHPDVATMRINLGDVLREQGEVDRAIEELSAAEEILRTTFGDDHPHRAVALGNLGICYADQGRFDDALAAMGQGLDVTRRRLGDAHPRVADAIYNIGVTQQEAGRPEDAYASFEDALRRQETAHGPDSVELVSPLRGLAELDQAAGRPSGAHVRLDRALTILRAQPEPDAAKIAEVQAAREGRPAG
jgi:tetratricopeptide (TPR) repeat protein